MYVTSLSSVRLTSESPVTKVRVVYGLEPDPYPLSPHLFSQRRELPDHQFIHLFINVLPHCE